MKKWNLFFTGAIAATIVAAGGRAIGRAEAMPPPRPMAPEEVSRYAVVASLSYLKLQKLIEQGKSEEASHLLDALYLQQLIFMMGNDKNLGDDGVYLDLKDKLVLGLQQRWLRSPPDYLPDHLAKYLDVECARIADCPRGLVHGRSAIPEKWKP